MKNKKLINSFKYAFTGMWSAYKSERNMKIHIAVAILVILFGVFLQISTYEWLACTVCFAMVIGSEMFNTAIETVVDIAMPKKDERAKKAKDVAAGGVLVFAIGSAIIGSIIFIPKIIDYLNLTIK
ncbi:MAG: diacylglycerol kinase family protein [Erysipelotrichaceae bacterium]|nr:diacylglycerol kinase family protein [Erysipelotrichaceae bacterium]